jgi:hypothetical protein
MKSEGLLMYSQQLTTDNYSEPQNTAHVLPFFSLLDWSIVSHKINDYKISNIKKSQLHNLNNLIANKRILFIDSLLYLMFTLPNITTYKI